MPYIHRHTLRAALFLASAIGPLAHAATLEVGPGKPFARIEEAHAKAQPGDTILIYPRADGRPYEKTAVFVRQPRLTFRGVPGADGRYVQLSGKGGNYSGQGSTPRAIFQFNRGTDQCVLENLELTGAHNSSHNGAGVRINQANHVTIRHCSIHDNDMGLMSNGDGTAQTGVNQRIEFCEIHHNGDPADPGYNHNLYLGGTSVTLTGCEVHSSLTGHNVKSRAHHTRVEYSYIHHSANREFDLVDAADTARPESHAVLLGNIIVKHPQCPGNRSVIHFGQDGGKEHDGTLYLAFNTIVTPYIGPVVELSAAKAKAHLMGNLVSDGGMRQNGQVVAAFRRGAGSSGLSGSHNWFSGGFSRVEGAAWDLQTTVFRRVEQPLFQNSARHDYRLRPEVRSAATVAVAVTEIKLPLVPGVPASGHQPPLTLQYRHPFATEKRPTAERLLLGANGAAEKP